MALPTYPVLSPDLYFPGLHETEKAVQALLLRIVQTRNPNAKVLSFEQARRARKRGQRLYDCRLHRAGLSSLREDQRDRVMALARSGAQIAGPLTVHDVDQWAAEVHHRTPWMKDLTTLLMRHMRSRVAAGRPGLPEVTPQIAGLMFDTLLREVDADIDQDTRGLVREAIIDAAGRGHVSLRQIRRILERLEAADPQILH